MKQQLIILTSLIIAGCGSYFSDFQTVYRIETTNGERYYSKSEPRLKRNQSLYNIEDLDGNKYQVKPTLIYKIEKFKHKK